MNLRIAILVVLGVLAFDAGAVVLYKHVDEKGRVTYFDRPVMPGDGARLERLDIDTSANPARVAPPAATARVESENERIIRRRPAEPDTRPLDAARQRLDAARGALEAAQASSTPEDWIYFGNRTRAPRPEYLARIESLENAMKAAEADVAEQERRVRLGPLFY